VKEEKEREWEREGRDVKGREGSGTGRWMPSLALFRTPEYATV